MDKRTVTPAAYLSSLEHDAEEWWARDVRRAYATHVAVWRSSAWEWPRFFAALLS